jgi:hypothetical protein
MESKNNNNNNNVQLSFAEDSITLNMSLFDGVLTTKTFDGPDCYLHLLNFLKQSFADENMIHATIIVSR